MVCFLCFCQKRKKVIMGYPEEAISEVKGHRRLFCIKKMLLVVKD